jgi:hypothetical protein
VELLEPPLAGLQALLLAELQAELQELPLVELQAELLALLLAGLQALLLVELQEPPLVELQELLLAELQALLLAERRLLAKQPQAKQLLAPPPAEPLQAVQVQEVQMLLHHSFPEFLALPLPLCRRLL